MNLKDNIYMMTPATWETWQAGVFEEAANADSPLPYIRFLSNIEVILDMEMKEGIVEVYHRMFFGRDNYSDRDEERG